MSIIRNRELSQFGSFIAIDDQSQNIAITTSTSNPYVGIGTTNPQEKLDVVGNVNISGDLNVGGTFDFNFDGFNIDGDVNINTTGIITASSFVNDEGILTVTDRWDKDGTTVYKIDGQIGIGTSVPSEKLSVIGNVSARQFISTVSSGTPPFQVTSNTEVANLNASLLRGGVPGQNINSGDIVTLGATQTLLNKTLTTPVFGSAGVTFNGTSGNTLVKANSTAAGVLVLPVTNGTLVSTGDTGVITSNMIADLNIVNSDIAIAASISYSKLNLTNSVVNSDIVTGTIANTKLANFSISGVSLGSSLPTLIRGTYLTGSNYNGSSGTTWAVDATSDNVGDKVVVRNSSGNFSSNSVTLSNNLTANQIIKSGITTSNLLQAGGGDVPISSSNVANNVVVRDSSGNIGVNSVTTSNISVSGSFKDRNNNVGTAGSVLSSTGSAVQWIAAFPSGGIILWSGTVATIPSGWVLCDGSNSTPDLRNRFVKGLSSGSPSTGSDGGYTGGSGADYYLLAYIMKT